MQLKEIDDVVYEADSKVRTRRAGISLEPSSSLDGFMSSALTLPRLQMIVIKDGEVDIGANACVPASAAAPAPRC